MSERSTHEDPVRPSSDLAAWRESRLRDAGFDQETASQLASEEAIDFHELLDLIDRGCPPHLAERILAPLEGAKDSR